MSKTHPIAVRLTKDEERELNAWAERTNSIAQFGTNAGRPSWRTMLRRLARGELTIEERAEVESE